MTGIQAEIDSIYRQEAARVRATLLRLLNGNFDLAEEALHDAFAAALSQWPEQGVPDKPRAWLISTGHFKAIDRLRKHGHHETYVAELVHTGDSETEALEDTLDQQHLADDRLRLIFTCCHPGLAMEARVAMTLREVCGLTTEALAAAFLIPAPTLAQRIVRAKQKIRDAHIPYEVPPPEALAERLDAVLQVIYLIYNEGYSASTGDRVVQTELSAEAIRLGCLLCELLPETEVMGLLALMLLHDARAGSRTTPTGELIPLEEQDRSLWNHTQIQEGAALTTRALQQGRPGAYALQAAIAAVHAEAPTPQDTDWAEITGLYQLLLQINPSPVVELNHAAALAMRDGPEAGLAAIQRLDAEGKLQDYYLLYAAKGDLYRRLQQTGEAIAAYQTALSLTRQAPEIRFLQQRLAALEALD